MNALPQLLTTSCLPHHLAVLPLQLRRCPAAPTLPAPLCHAFPFHPCALWHMAYSPASPGSKARAVAEHEQGWGGGLAAGRQRSSACRRCPAAPTLPAPLCHISALCWHGATVNVSCIGWTVCVHGMGNAWYRCAKQGMGNAWYRGSYSAGSKKEQGGGQGQLFCWQEKEQEGAGAANLLAVKRSRGWPAPRAP